MSDKIYPISFLDANQCLNCKSSGLVLVLKDIDVIELDKEGSTNETYNVYHESYVLCPKCESQFNYNKYGFFIKPVSDNVYLRQNKKIKYKEKNPFLKEE